MVNSGLMGTDGAALGAAGVSKFVDYRQYLKARLEFLQKQDAKFSYQYCAGRLKTTRSYLHLVIQGKRHITLDRVGPLAKLFKLNAVEKQALLFRFLQSQTSDSDLTEFFEASLSSLVARERAGSSRETQRSNVSLIPIHQRVLQAWQWSEDFQRNTDWIRKNARPGVFTDGDRILDPEPNRDPEQSRNPEQKAGSKQNTGSEQNRDPEKNTGPKISDAPILDSSRFESYRAALGLAQRVLGESPIDSKQRVTQVVCALTDQEWKEIENLHLELTQRLTQILEKQGESTLKRRPYLGVQLWMPLSQAKE
jgi:hypothetical protein